MAEGKSHDESSAASIPVRDPLYAPKECGVCHRDEKYLMTDDSWICEACGSVEFPPSGVSGSSSREKPSGDGAANPVASAGGVGHSKPPEGAGSHPATSVGGSSRLDPDGHPTNTGDEQ